MSQSNVRQPGGQPQAGANDQDAALRAQFEAEVLAADLTVPAHDREQLFVMWAEHRPIRVRLRTTDIALEEEPSFTQKPAQAGAGVTLSSSPSGKTGGPA